MEKWKTWGMAWGRAVYRIPDPTRLSSPRAEKRPVKNRTPKETVLFPGVNSRSFETLSTALIQDLHMSSTLHICVVKTLKIYFW